MGNQKLLAEIACQDENEEIRLSAVAKIKDSARQYLRAIAGIFEDGIRGGLFLDRHPIAFADIVWSLFTGVVLWEDTKKGFDANKDFLRPTLGLAIEILCRGIKKN